MLLCPTSALTAKEESITLPGHLHSFLQRVSPKQIKTSTSQKSNKFKLKRKQKKERALRREAEEKKERADVEETTTVINNIEEHLYFGNTHSQLPGHINSHNWSAFISLAKDKVIPPLTVKSVRYFLHPTFNKVNPNEEKQVVVTRTPFKTTHRGYGTFRVAYKLKRKREDG